MSSSFPLAQKISVLFVNLAAVPASHVAVTVTSSNMDHFEDHFVVAMAVIVKEGSGRESPLISWSPSCEVGCLCFVIN